MAVRALNTEQEDRWQTIKAIWQANHWLYGVMGFLLGLLAFPALRMVVDDAAELASGLVPETVGIVVTVLFIERLNERRDERRRNREEIERLIRDAGSPIRDVAVHTIDQIRKLGLLGGFNGILQSAQLDNANLEGANLFEANLQYAYLWWADLSRANLNYVNLEGAHSSDINLQNANLQEANLRNANLYKANLKGANMWEADLRGAYITDASFSEDTTLPDGLRWTPKTDMAKYTDPKHPFFWQPERLKWLSRD